MLLWLNCWASSNEGLSPRVKTQLLSVLLLLLSVVREADSNQQPSWNRDNHYIDLFALTYDGTSGKVGMIHPLGTMNAREIIHHGPKWNKRHGITAIKNIAIVVIKSNNEEILKTKYSPFYQMLALTLTDLNCTTAACSLYSAGVIVCCCTSVWLNSPFHKVLQFKDAKGIIF